MAEGGRPTKRERREHARAERRAREAAAAKRRRQRRIVTVAVAVAALAAVVILVAVTRQPPAPTNIAIERTAAVDAFSAAGCGEVDVPALPSSPHLEAGAPPAHELYPVRPTSQGPHLGNVAPVGVADRLDERVTTHNLEHGAVVVWYDPDAGVDGGAIEKWATDRNRAGFDLGRAGAGILASPYRDDFTSGKAVALRAWGTAIDCDQFDPLVADAFLIERFGTRGNAPERGLAGYPNGVLYYASEGPAAEPTETAAPPG
ncbi:MAG: DUF3105 domain-containing protein [Actinomycetota bacterium]|nr:DUF3105 domain-containing protein [Actinomycetota bacterium]